jgi:hypothetical protein
MVEKVEEKKFPTPFKKTLKTPAFSTFRRGFDFLRKLLIQIRGLALKLILLLLSPFLKPRKRLCSQKIIG